MRTIAQECARTLMWHLDPREWKDVSAFPIPDVGGATRDDVLGALEWLVERGTAERDGDKFRRLG